jgi:hypothetical protein
MDSKTWYDQTYSSCGSRDAWIWETVNGKDYDTRKSHFSAFVTVTERLDRSTAQIASFVLREGKVLMGFNQQHQVLNVTSLRPREDEAGGWALCGTPIGVG